MSIIEGRFIGAINGLDKSPFILPNKPYVKEHSMDESGMPDDIKKTNYGREA